LPEERSAYPLPQLLRAVAVALLGLPREADLALLLAKRDRLPQAADLVVAEDVLVPAVRQDF
jgi:hypothetical protein